MKKNTAYQIGDTVIRFAYSPTNQRWFVWREDAGHQALLETFRRFDKAFSRYAERVRFLASISEADYPGVFTNAEHYISIANLRYRYTN